MWRQALIPLTPIELLLTPGTPIAQAAAQLSASHPSPEQKGRLQQVSACAWVLAENHTPSLCSNK